MGATIGRPRWRFGITQRRCKFVPDRVLRICIGAFCLMVPAADGQWPPLRGCIWAGAVQAGMMARDKTSSAKGRGTARKGGGGVRSDDCVLSEKHHARQPTPPPQRARWGTSP